MGMNIPGMRKKIHVFALLCREPRRGGNRRLRTVGGQVKVVEHIVRYGLLQVSSVDLKREKHNALDENLESVI